MAHVAKLSELSGELVAIITGKPQDNPSYNSLRDQTVTRLREHSYARTNQFEIKERYDGLVEKFSVLNRDDLAEALQQRLDELPTRVKWMPEYLSLLLELSDRPFEKTKISDLDEQTTPETSSPELTWEQILADDPLQDASIWDSVGRGYHSSGDDANESGEVESDRTVSTQASSVDGEDYAALARRHVIQPQVAALSGVEMTVEACSRPGIGKSTILSELTMIRETLTMLRGLPTDLYTPDHQPNRLMADSRYVLATAVSSTTQALLNQFVEIGNVFNALRLWSSSKQKAAITQAMQAATQITLRNIAAGIGEIELRFVQPRPKMVASLAEVHAKIQSFAEPVLVLSRVIMATAEVDRFNAVVLMEQLYIAVCGAQMSGDQPTFTLLADVLLAGCRTHLHLVHIWITTGSLPAHEKSDFFVTEIDSMDLSLGRLWQGRFTLHTQDGESCRMPFFLRAHIDKIFTMGKNRAFMERLKSSTEMMSPYDPVTHCSPDFSSILSDLAANPFIPFSQALDDEINIWLETSSQTDNTCLRRSLLNDHGFAEVLRALEFIYFARDGTSFQAFADSLISHVEARRTFPSNCFILTEMAQDAFRATLSVSLGSLGVKSLRVDAEQNMPHSMIQRLSTLQLDYVFPWSAQNITHCTSSIAHAQTLVFLLQIYRAKVLLYPALFSIRKISGTTKSSGTSNFSTTAALKLRQRLLWFTDVFYTHVTSTASALHSSMTTQMETADGIDSMSAIWEHYVQQLSTSLLLSDRLHPIRGAITAVLSTCESFAQYWSHTLECDEGVENGGVKSTVTEDDSYPVLMLQDMKQSLSFIVAGLRGLSRAGGDNLLEALAEQLELNTPG